MRACLAEARTVSENQTPGPISRQERNNVSSDIRKGFNWEEVPRLRVFIFCLLILFCVLCIKSSFS